MKFRNPGCHCHLREQPASKRPQGTAALQPGSCQHSQSELCTVCAEAPLPCATPCPCHTRGQQPGRSQPRPPTDTGPERSAAQRSLIPKLGPRAAPPSPRAGQPRCLAPGLVLLQHLGGERRDPRLFCSGSRKLGESKGADLSESRLQGRVSVSSPVPGGWRAVELGLCQVLLGGSPSWLLNIILSSQTPPCGDSAGFLACHSRCGLTPCPESRRTLLLVSNARLISKQKGTDRARATFPCTGPVRNGQQISNCLLRRRPGLTLRHPWEPPGGPGC